MRNWEETWNSAKNLFDKKTLHLKAIKDEHSIFSSLPKETNDLIFQIFLDLSLQSLMHTSYLENERPLKRAKVTTMVGNDFHEIEIDEEDCLKYEHPLFLL